MTNSEKLWISVLFDSAWCRQPDCDSGAWTETRELILYRGSAYLKRTRFCTDCGHLHPRAKSLVPLKKRA